ncbi:MAG TPA: IPT/TIG domain-containing protein [Bryobacteraceae bacterium]|nr:IPT/TIG domain-containing protein [Bryobacteraceae bacterium]
MSLVPWVTIVSGGLGSGNGTLQWAVAANADSISRTGTIIVPGRIFTITQAAVSSSNPSSLYIPGYYAVDAAYAKPIDKLVLVSANPNQLHIFDPAARRDTVVQLNAPPLSLSVRPDGVQAAVGHDGWVTLVDLNTAAILNVISVPTDVHSLILAGNGYAYLFPQQEWGDLFSLELSSGQIARTSAIYNGREPRLHVNGKNIYVGGQWQSKWDISGGVAKLVNGWPSSGCGKLWLTEDGRRFFGDCGKAYTTSEVPAQDYQYNGSLSNATRIVWLDESAKAATIAAIPSAGPAYSSSAKSIDDTQVQLYGDAYLGYLGAIPLPKFIVGGTAFPAHGRYVFWNQSGTGLYAVVQADSKALLTGGTAITELSVSDARQVAVKSVVNSASQSEGRIAPGELISIYGTGMGPQTGASFALDPVSGKANTSLAGTEVYINGLAAPILYASDTQVNAIVPFAAPVSGQVILQVGTQGILSEGVTVTMTAAAPGVFTMNGSGSGQAVAVNLDGTLCDSAHPAAAGSYITVYFTGGGSTTPVGSTGSVAGLALKRLSQTALATVADIPATVSFAGAAPTLLEGVNQLNIKLSEETPPGLAQPLIVTVGNNSSPASATIAVK